ncbi:MAG: outer membrane protein assembly factor BamB family protein [Ktedonobacteraceae bacterium]
MKSWLSDEHYGCVFRLVCSIFVVVVMGGAGALFGLKLVAASTFATATRATPSLVTPTPPSDNTLGLSVTSGPPGTHVFISASGFQPKESVRPTWNYGGPGTVIVEGSFYYFNPAGTADANGVVYMSLFAPNFPTRDYTIAAIGAQSGIVKTAVFHLTPLFETGVVIGNPNTALRLRGWSFGATEAISMYWNWTSSSNPGTLIGTASTDTKGSFSNRTFTVPGGTPNGLYTLAALGATSHAVALTQFTVGTPQLNTQVNAYDWPDFGHDLQGTRVNPTEKTITTSNVKTLAVKWKSPFPVSYRVTGSPIIVNGIAYVGTVQGFLVAFDITNGNTLWTFAAKAPIYGSPTIANGIAYFGSVNYPAGGLIGNYAYAVNATDGSLIWENYLDNGADWVDPIVSNGRVFVPSALKEAMSGGFSAFDANTGATLWSFATPYGIWSSPTMDPTGTNLYVDSGNPCLDSGGANCSGYVLDINPATGAIKWQYLVADISGDDDIPTTATYGNGGKLYVGSKNGIFYCLNATNGTVLHLYDTGDSGDSGIFSSAALYNGKAYFGGGDFKIHALNTNDFSVAWSFTSNRIFMSSPAVANNVLYSGGGDGNVYAFNASSGLQLWSYKIGVTVISSPVISNGVLYVSGSDGYFYAFSPGGV